MLIAVGAYFNTTAQTITKTASASSVHIGEIFEYTINISGVTNFSDLGRIDDLLDPGLDYLGTDFNTTSVVYSFYNSWCPASIGSLIAPAPYTTGLLNFTFPSSTLCSGTGSGNLSFKIKVAVNANACPTTITSISNTVKWYNQSNTLVATSAPSIVTIDHSSPWTLKKTFRAYTGGFLIYDVRLSSSVEHYNMNVLPTANLTDDFTGNTCLGVDAANSKVDYIPVESNLSSFTTLAYGIPVGANDLKFTWSPLPASLNPTLSSFLFQIKIKVTSCSCPSTAFNLLNHVNLTATDMCNAPVVLDDNFPLNSVKCTPDPTPPDQAKLCVKKEVLLDNNNLNLTMSGCTGKYVITITNCTNTFNYTSINLTDIFPSSSLLTIGTISVLPAVYSAGLTSTSSSLTFNPTTTLAHGATITITIPFTVTTPLPNQHINNCADITVVLDDGTSPVTTLTQHFCDNGIVTVPNNIAVIKDKQICTSPAHSCGGQTINNYLPGDPVEYSLHVFNYGTGLGTNVIVTDDIPAYINVNITDVNVYQLVGSGNIVSNICIMPGLFTEITSTTNRVLTGNHLVIDFLANNLDKFTCSGITHYIIKIKGQLANNAPNGSYSNSFMIQYTDAGTGVVQPFEYSNTVTLVVNKDNLVFIDKRSNVHAPDCVNKTTVVDYEIWAINMGYQPIAINVNDVLTVPSPLSLVSGISNISSELSPSGVITNPLVSSGIMTVTNTATTLTINNYTIAPCNLVKFRYSVIYNTNNLNVGQLAQVCNDVKITAGYLVNNYNPNSSDLHDIVVSKNPELINEFFDNKTDLGKYKALEKIKQENKTENKKTGFATIPIHGSDIVFVPFDTLTSKKCDDIRDCVGGSGAGCFTATGSNNFSFIINSIDNLGIANTTLTIPAAAPKVRKVEIILADIRMLVNLCPPPHPPFYFTCHNCSQTAEGNFYTTTASIGSLSSVFIAYPSIGYFREKNKVEFSSSTYSNITGSYNIPFQLPVNTLNCNGNLEVVITAIVYFEDCSVCYVSSAIDHHAAYSWYPHFYTEVIPGKK